MNFLYMIVSKISRTTNSVKSEADQFKAIMLANWSADELAYMEIAVWDTM